MPDAPEFWYRPAGAAARLLQPAGWAYAFGARLRGGWSRAARAGVPVICIGNPTLGGAGKTPVAIAVSGILREAGLVPHFVSKGYGGRLDGPLTVEPGAHSAADVGDEPLLLARHGPVHVAHDRRAGLRHAADAGANVIVMDDGFQNPTVHKDFSILVVDSGAGIGNGLVFPAGPLRAPLDAQLAACDALVLVGVGDAGAEVAASARAADVPVLHARLAPEPGIAATLNGAEVVAFAGIGRPEKFRATLEGLGAHITAFRAFPDHHAYTAADVAEILTLAKAAPGARIVTTEKDFVRFTEANDPREGFRETLTQVPVTLMFDDRAAVGSRLTRIVTAAR